MFERSAIVQMNARPHPGLLPQERENCRPSPGKSDAALKRSASAGDGRSDMKIIKPGYARCSFSLGEKVRMRASVIAD
jgi:hypothetical protein